MIPKHIYEGTDFRANPANNTPIGTGPMKFKEWRKGSYIQLVRNEKYWDKGKPYLDEIYFQFIPDAAARAVAYETGKVDVLTGGAVEIFDVARLSQAAEHLRDDQGLGDVRAASPGSRLNDRSGIRRQQEVPPGHDARDRPRVRQGRGLVGLRQDPDRADLVEDEVLLGRRAEI